MNQEDTDADVSASVDGLVVLMKMGVVPLACGALVVLIIMRMGVEVRRCVNGESGSIVDKK